MTSPFQRALRDELLAAAKRAEPARRRPHLGRIAAAIAAVAATVVGSVVVFSPGPAAADIDITIEDGVVTVTLDDLQTDPEEVRDAMVEAGLDARVEAVPTGLSNVGRFVSVVVEDAPSVPIEEREKLGTSFLGFSLREGWPGKLVIHLGRLARPGERYVTTSDAFGEGEVLHCTDIRGHRLADLTDDLAGLTVRVQGPGAEIGTPLLLEDALPIGYDDWFVGSGLAMRSDVVLLQIQPDPPVPIPDDPSC